MPNVPLQTLAGSETDLKNILQKFEKPRASAFPYLWLCQLTPTSTVSSAAERVAVKIRKQD